MVNGVNGLRGLSVLYPVLKEHVLDTDSVAPPHQRTMGLIVMETVLKTEHV